MKAFFLSTPDGERLFALWRGKTDASRVWVLCPPVAEEDKSARRTLSDIANWLEARGEASLLFSFRGTGDSSGDYADATFAGWSTDLQAALAYANQEAPNAQLGVLGARLGASLALLENRTLAAYRVSFLVLIEPILVGRQFLSQQSARKKMRAQLTAGESSASETAAPAPTSTTATEVADGPEDFDGWPLATALRSDFQSLDLRQGQAYGGQAYVLSVGPRSEVPPPLQALAEELDAKTQAVVMPAFWNLLDYPEPRALLDALERTLGEASL